VENLHVNLVIFLLQFDYKTIILFESNFLHFDNMEKRKFISLTLQKADF